MTELILDWGNSPTNWSNTWNSRS